MEMISLQPRLGFSSAADMDDRPLPFERPSASSVCPHLRIAATMSARCQPGIDGFMAVDFRGTAVVFSGDCQGSLASMVEKTDKSTRKTAIIDADARKSGGREISGGLNGEDGGGAFRLPDGSRMELIDRFKFALRLVPVDQRAELGRQEKTLRTWKSASDMSLDVIFALSAKTGIPFSWITEGKVSGWGSQREMAEYFSFVPQLYVEAAAGAGILSPEMSVDADVVAFRSDWLRKLGVNPRYARAMFARGDSMWPTISDGDLLLVDESITSVVDDGIYIIISQGAVRVKRLQVRRDGSLLIKSDNSAYEPELVPAEEIDDVRVAARVRWYGRAI
ncbi:MULTISPECIES: S24 family peptidase [unclassified Bradyrhizobium]|uniref:S24 family peptidase n=1 Tax=unclassified Bradyrhizobium TaxID=2631580 RepID=UPI00359C695C